ncbi:MAG TPA: DUF3298 domain-containing protein [Limnochordia bacterium]|nr:DUF3298 domain-containing protein [Limnochordia bacterium]HPZ30308.1 DUF3298 domain-containing protein [Limnochordia bacterium]HQD69882.1 DUF3298 domain-containing protein [Limnochordia bacterium]
MHLAKCKGTMVFVMILITAASIGHAANPAPVEHKVNPYWYRIIDGLPNTDVVILSRVYEKVSPSYSSVLLIPVIHGLQNQELYEQLNSMFYDGILHFDEEMETITNRFLQENTLLGQQLPSHSTEVDFKVNYNSGGILSLTVRFTHAFGFNQRSQFMETVNVDLTTGRIIELADLFATEQERSILIKTINNQLKKNPSAYFVTEFSSSDLINLQSFYISENKIIIYFDANSIAPSALGIPEFVVEISSALNELSRSGELER